MVMRAQDPPASTISGAILDAESGRPLTGARIDLTPLGRATISDAAGQYAFEDIAPGAYQVLVDTTTGVLWLRSNGTSRVVFEARRAGTARAIARHNALADTAVVVVH